jgi:hypothetical protein
VAIPNYWVWVWGILGGLALAALAFRVWRTRQQRKALVTQIPPAPAHVIARQRLEEALTLIHQPKPFTILVSDTLRLYLEAAFELRAPEQTTDEFLVELRHSPQLSEGQKTSLGDFLERCDLVKFARYEPREPELRELHRCALELVQETEPPPDAAAEPAPPERRRPMEGNEASSSVPHQP